MKYRNAFWLSLVCGIGLACSPVLAQGPQHDALPPLPNGQQPGALPGGLPPLPLPDAERTIPGAYRLTYTLAEMDGSKRIGSHRYEIVLDAGHDVPPARLSLGTKVPVETGVSGENALPSLPQITYIDIGLNINARLRQFANGLELSSNISQSAVDSQQALLKSPVIRQTGLSSTVLLTENKPTILGTMDELGSSRRLQIEVEVTTIP